MRQCSVYSVMRTLYNNYNTQCSHNVIIIVVTIQSQILNDRVVRGGRDTRSIYQLADLYKYIFRMILQNFI